ncbi:hypothetical protein A3D77_06895 [Candidatus Gottesmanbacteria bacterium RIFCSPHIGHO2_02_FULL_39_11]|uniref:Membrane protein 6-pyruvoyl-tetrahydropterin synthase-related domain-containing protein n=1 Tax=Candidatus Gottesmanbacteria bacterium RIFCSPHIGHO2_02_FULL_39_11 TaxID=1798382 RepID=A0A1F5ZJS5_9BACT|nr:MAG: hypothetical protein A3D77_06895 [Candidatus Gottesmanbacteria bacterium RIFCSPHIGHO2_02_FULL_39_11]
MRFIIKIFPFFVIFLVSFLLLYPVLFVGKDQIIYGGDLALQFYYWKGFLAESIKHGVIPFWNPYLFSGTPFLAHPGVAPFSLSTLFFLLLGLNSSFSWVYLIHFIIAGIGMYYFARIYTERATSIISSLVFICSGYFAARIYAGHVDLFTTAVWIPWVFAFFIRRKIVPTIISLIFLIVSGYSAYFIFTVEFLALYTCFMCLKDKDTILKNVRNLFIPIILAVLITSVAWMPTYELAKNSIRGSGLPYDISSWGSLPLSGVKLFLSPLDRVELNKISFNLGGGPRENPFDHFAGVTPILVVTGGILISFLSRLSFLSGEIKKTSFPSDFWFFIIISFFSLWVSFGYFAPVNIHGFLYDLLPMYRMIRIPLQHLILVVVLVPVLTGIVINAFPFFVRIGIGLLMILELVWWGKPFIFITSIPDHTFDQKLISNVVTNPSGSRVLPYYRVVSPVLSDMDLNAFLKYRIFSTSGYDPVILKNYFHFIENSAGISDAVHNYNVEIPPVPLKKDLVSFLGIKKIITEKNEEVEKNLPDFHLEEEGKTYKLYKTSQDYKYFTLIESLDNSVCKKKAEEIKTDTNSYVFKTESPCNATLSTSIPYYPGFKVFVDGEEKPFHFVNSGFDGVDISSGSHRVEIKYIPRIYYIGGVISLIGITGLIGWFYYERKP